MRKSLLIAVCSIFLLGSATQAQNVAKSWTIGGGIGYHTEFDDDNTGLVLEGMYSFTDEIRASLGILYYFADQPDEGSITFFDININAHYIFKNDEDLRIYALAGINSFNFEAKGGGVTESGDETGFNIGAGIEYDIGSVMLFGELKMTTGDVHDSKFIIHAGIRYTF